MFMALKIAAMSVAAIQVRAGYPSVQESMAAGSGQGRHSFYFYRHVDGPHWVMFQARPPHLLLPSLPDLSSLSPSAHPHSRIFPHCRPGVVCSP